MDSWIRVVAKTPGPPTFLITIKKVGGKKTPFYYMPVILYSKTFFCYIKVNASKLSMTYSLWGQGEIITFFSNFGGVGGGQ